MGVFDSATQWFNEQEKQSKQLKDGAKRDTVKITENDFNNILKQMEADEQDRLKTKRKEYIDSFMPKEPVLDYRQYEMKSDKTLHDKAVADNKDDYLLESQDIEKRYNEDIAKADLASKKAREQSREEGEKIKYNGIKGMEAFKQRIVKNNLVDSSIMSDGRDKIIENSQGEIKHIKSMLDSALEQVAGQKAQALDKKEYSEDKIEREYKDKVSKQVERDRKSEQAKKDRVTEYNRDLDEKKAKYDEDVRRISVERGMEYDRQLDKLENYETRFGYSGERKAEYDERLRLAKQFYSQFPKEQAMQMIMHNRDLPALLGYYYEVLARDINNA